jgi:DNA-binding SARP family transcriptional activator
MDELRIHLLGGFRVFVGTREIADDAWRLPKAKALVKLLALAPGHQLHRDHVVDQLWPDLSPDAAASQFRKALHDARPTLDPAREATQRFIQSGARPGLSRDITSVDVQAFEDAALAARRGGEPERYETTIALYGGDLLPEDRYEDWVVAPESVLCAEFFALLVQLALLLEARADFDRAAASLRCVVAADPAHEDAAEALMRVYALAGRRHEALVEYDLLRRALDRELGVEPGPATQRL